jgi:hypothetical protein
MAQQHTPSSGYGGTWKKWIWVYLVAAAVIYGIVYFAFMRDSGGSGSGGGTGNDGGTGYLLFVLSPAVFERLRDRLRRR